MHEPRRTNTAVISLGSNIDPEKYIRKAKRALGAVCEVLKESAFIYTKPLLDTEQPDFLNGACVIATTLDQEHLEKELKSIEARLARVRDPNNPNGPRTIDLDVLIFNDRIVDSDVYKRDFLRRFITELLPDYELPTPV